VTRATHIGVALASLLLVTLAASGAWLWWNYLPGGDEWIRVVHQATAIALLVDAALLVVLAILRRGRTGATGVVAGLGVFATVGAAYVLGRLLAWDQLALWAVTTGRSSSGGVALTFESQVKYVLIDGRQVSASTYHWWAVLHLVLAVLVVGALVLLWMRTRDPAVSRRRPSPAPASPPAA
jgi:quinol-cytochrome oxidoreductase complex cytochrome b subunit